MDKDIKISVVIPAYNVEKYIERSLESVLRQTYLPFEILVVNDGSTDHTEEVIESYKDKIEYFVQQNRGISSARNIGIKNAKSNWIAFLDADDEWIDTHLENFITVISQKPDLMWYGAPVRHVDEITNRVLFSYKTVPSKNYIDKLYFKDYLRALPPCGFFSTPTMIIRREVFDNVGLFNPHQLTGEDRDMWFRIGLRYPEIGYCTQLGATIFKRKESISRTKNWAPIEMLERFGEYEEMSRKFGDSSYLRAKPRITFWVIGLLRRALSNADLYALKKIKEAYFHDLPIKYKILLKLILGCPVILKMLLIIKGLT